MRSSVSRSGAATRAVVPTVVLALVAALLLAVAPPSSAAPRDRLTVGTALTAGAALESANGRNRLTVQSDGNLVLRSPGRLLWATGTAGGTRLALQTDGNLVLLDTRSAVLWTTRTSGARELVVQDDGNLVLLGGTAAAPRALWSSRTPLPRLLPGEFLTPGETVTSADGRYRLALTAAGALQLTGPGRTLWAPSAPPATRLTMQTDGNLVLTDAGGTVWASGTAGRTGAVMTVAAGRVDVTAGATSVWHSPSPPARLTAGTWLLPGERLVSASGRYQLVVQGDGNVVLYGPGGAAWTTRTSGPVRGLLLQTDGNLVLYGTTRALWSTRTSSRPPGFLQLQDDGHLVLYSSTGAAQWAVWARSAGLTAAVAAAAAFGAASGERTAVAVLDRSTGLLYTAGDATAPYASASLVKVFIAARLLSTGAQSDPATNALMYRMITLSDDDAATQLWPRAGGAAVTDWVRTRYGVTGLGHPTAAGWWGLTQVTATAMVRFYAAVKADPAVGPWLTDAMAHAGQRASDGWNQWFGLPSATIGWKVKQGWMCCLDNRSRLHSTGFLDGDRYTAAILTDGPTAFYGQRGAGVVTGAAARLLPGRRVPA